MKKLFKNSLGEIHFGMNADDGFGVAQSEDVEKALKNLGNKKLWRCNVCNDVHIGEIPPKVCPTCYVTDAYVEINEKEFRKMLT